jgi:hydrogenase maturation protein HypF
VGAHLKNTVALAHGRQIYLSQHIGDLATPAAHAAFCQVGRELPALFGVTPEVYAADAHPDYLSTQWARASGRHVICVQHHYAHVLACMAENDAAAPLLGVAWDGTGFGVDQTIWGGEFLRVADNTFERVGHLRCFRLPGGDKAVQEPRRAALGLLYALLGDGVFERRKLAPVAAFTPYEIQGIRQMLRRGVNAPTTSSAGRLFDAVASLVGLRQAARFEGQAAMDLEFALERDESDATYRIEARAPGSLPAHDGELCVPCPAHAECQAFHAAPPRLVLDWGPMVKGILYDLDMEVPAWEISAKFHNTLAEGIVTVAHAVGERRVVLTGGCFQNRYLLERTVQRLRSDGFSPYWHQRVPANDGGVALGQVMAAARARQKPKH